MNKQEAERLRDRLDRYPETEGAKISENIHKQGEYALMWNRAFSGNAWEILRKESDSETKGIITIDPGAQVGDPAGSD